MNKNSRICSLRLFMRIAMLLTVFAGCESYVVPLGPINPTITDAKQCQDCRAYLAGVPESPACRPFAQAGLPNDEAPSIA